MGRQIAVDRRDWYPTARSRQLTDAAGGTWTLTGQVHARQIGDSVTACGINALNWPMQFYRQFGPVVGGNDDICHECRSTIWGEHRAR